MCWSPIAVRILLFYFFFHSLGVQNYPRKAQKTQSREENTAVIIFQATDNKMLVVQRPKTGWK